MFITLEGPEGSGKTTQARVLHQHFRERGRAAMLVREPGGTPLGDKLRDILMFGNDLGISPRAELLLFIAARAQLVDQVIRPHLETGETVICDRYADSTLAYQGYGRALSIPEIKAINHFATGGLVPDLTLILDIPPEIGLARNQKGEPAVDRFEQESLEFHRRVRKGYLEVAKAEPNRCIVIDATRPAEQVWETIREAVERKMFGDAG